MPRNIKDNMIKSTNTTTGTNQRTRTVLISGLMVATAVVGLGLAFLLLGNNKKTTTTTSSTKTTATTSVITATSGTLTNGGAITLTGSNFGTKPTAAPLKYDNFESGTLGNGISGWSHPAGWSKPTYSNARLRTNSTKSVECAFDYRTSSDFNYSCNFGVSGDPGDISPINNLVLPQVYLDVWYYYRPSTPPSRNHKIFRLHSNTGGAGNPNEYLNVYCTTGLLLNHDGGGSGEWISDQFPQSAGIDWFQGRWRHIQFYTRESSVNVADGDARLTLDGTVVLDRLGAWNTRTAAGQHYWSAWMGNYLAHDMNPPCGAVGTYSDDAWTYWDNAYIDTSWAHVELGNAPTYTASTLREIQPATSWSDSSITFTLNQGAFTDLSNVYVYVTDATGVVNPNGFRLVSGGSTPPSGPGGCFPGDTLVNTPSGLKPIGQLKMGDMVYAYDQSTGRTVTSTVTRTFVHQEESYGLVTFSDGSSVQVTAVHRFYNPQTKQWQEIGTMKPGDVVLHGLGSAAKPLTITSLEFTSHRGTVYNLEVDRYHTYYVNGILVHNAKQQVR